MSLQVIFNEINELFSPLNQNVTTILIGFTHFVNHIVTETVSWRTKCRNPNNQLLDFGLIEKQCVDLIENDLYRVGNDGKNEPAFGSFGSIVRKPQPNHTTIL